MLVKKLLYGIASTAVCVMVVVMIGGLASAWIPRHQIDLHDDIVVDRRMNRTVTLLPNYRSPLIRTYYII